MRSKQKILILTGCLIFFHLLIMSAEGRGGFTLAEIKVGNLEGETENKTEIYFVGDVMLARDVERRMKVNGFDYPFQDLNINKETSYLVGNFEGSIPVVHEPTQNNTFRFSVDAMVLPALQEVGFTHFSLANNHSFDFGAEGYENTLLNFTSHKLRPFGHPVKISSSSIEIVEFSDHKVALVAMNTVFGLPSASDIQLALTQAEKNSDYQIVYIHWGNEYSHQSNEQRQFAKILAEAGTDIVVGHHPHVTQGIEMIGDTLVFYSLGNYVFDQYFGEAVQKGLMLRFAVEKERGIEIIPVSTQENLIQPRVSLGQDKAAALLELAKISDPELSRAINNGWIPMPFELASSREGVIMKE